MALYYQTPEKPGVVARACNPGTGLRQIMSAEVQPGQLSKTISKARRVQGLASARLPALNKTDKTKMARDVVQRSFRASPSSPQPSPVGCGSMGEVEHVLRMRL